MTFAGDVHDVLRATELVDGLGDETLRQKTRDGVPFATLMSKAGIIPGIRRLATETLPVNLAVSLHAANDAQRSSIMPGRISACGSTGNGIA